MIFLYAKLFFSHRLKGFERIFFVESSRVVVIPTEEESSQVTLQSGLIFVEVYCGDLSFVRMTKMSIKP